MGFDLSPSLYPIICPWCLETTSTSYRLPFVFEGSQLLFVLPCRPPVSFAWFPAQENGLFLSLDKMKHLIWMCFFPRTISRVNCPSRSVNWPESTLSSFPPPPLLGLWRIIENIFKATLRSLRCHTWDLSFRHCYTAFRMLSLCPVLVPPSTWLLNCSYVPHVPSWFCAVCPYGSNHLPLSCVWFC